MTDLSEARERRSIEDIKAAFFAIHNYATKQVGAKPYMTIPVSPDDADVIVTDAIQELARLRDAMEAADLRSTGLAIVADTAIGQRDEAVRLLERWMEAIGQSEVGTLSQDTRAFLAAYSLPAEVRGEKRLTITDLRWVLAYYIWYERTDLGWGDWGDDVADFLIWVDSAPSLIIGRKRP